MKWTYLFGVAALGLLVGCSGAPQPKFQASIGTYNPGTGVLGRAYVLVLRPQQQPESITVVVSGPNGYSENLLLQSAQSRSASGAWWQIGWDTAHSLQGGSYTFTTVLDGKTEQVEVNVDAASSLTPPSVTVTNPSVQNVAVSWTAVAGAQAYLVRLVDQNTNAVVARRMVSSLSTTFSSLNLSPGGAYRAEVYAASSNIAFEPPLVPPQFNLALGQTSFNVGP
ncbi:MAG: hypothetical protein NZ849_02930 [Meiothermus sp.]|uniref:hypothetical protein n=1 Tax=Meiothermus sp. TaxID=1955249 RepID=UPI0025DF5B7A|nr:hypothetical protein [Meiothermus sp.]MCS7059261.1 hypothetical protein [Meiothermus sp.]MCS7193856.1 hypothetical protein [Meiothermus sp.]MCX7739545.1 hypothetical protein [Meiothermus sp.]MDW8090316.1 hypothetical protein [Meiothermus sp.]MDW8481278.1 hypothetical protein [Meiothermus sp.]